MIEGIIDGSVDCIATDHAPHAAHEKEQEFERAPNGITGLESALGLSIAISARETQAPARPDHRSAQHAAGSSSGPQGPRKSGRRIGSRCRDLRPRKEVDIQGL